MDAWIHDPTLEDDHIETLEALRKFKLCQIGAFNPGRDPSKHHASVSFRPAASQWQVSLEVGRLAVVSDTALRASADFDRYPWN